MPALRQLHALPAAPVVTLAGVLLLPVTPDDAAGTLAVVADGPGRWLAASLLMLLGQALLVPGGVGLARRMSAAGSRAGAVGGVALALSGVLHVGVLGYTLAQLPIAEAGATSAAELMFGSPAFVVLIVATLLATYTGVLLAAVGLHRTRVVPRWVPVALVVAPVLEFLHDPIGTYATFVVWAVAFTVVVRETSGRPRVPAGVAAA